LAYKIIFKPTRSSSYSVCSTLFYTSEVDCEESNVEHEPELVDECKEILTSMQKLLASYVAKIDPDPEPPVLIESDIVENPEPKPEVEEPLIEILADLPAEPTRELVPSLTVMRASLFLRSPNIYNSLQIFFTGDVIIGDQFTHGAKYNLFVFHHR